MTHRLPRRPRLRGLIHLILGLVCLMSAGARADGFLGNPDVETFIAEMVSRHGFTGQELRTLLGRLTPNAVVLRAIKPPSRPEQRSWQRYRARFVNDRRIEAGRRFLAEHADSLTRAESRFGVPREIITAIIGVETEYGSNMGRFNAVEALATLAFHYPPRAVFFRDELEALLLLGRDNALDLATLTGSYAGALGVPQFMPSSQRAFAVDHDGDGRIDLRTSVDDAIGSVAAFLSAHGWQPGTPLIAPAQVADTALRDQWLAADIRPTLQPDALGAAGVDITAFPPAQAVALIELVTPQQASEYWWGWQNFYVVTRYNRSSFYALSVIQLAQALGLR